MFAMTYELGDAGWIMADLRADGQAVTVMASYLSDAPLELLEATIRLLRGMPQSECRWQTEPGSFLWTLARSGQDVHVRLWEQRATATLVFETRCSLQRFANVVLNQLWSVHQRWGEEGYAQRWSHAFPRRAYEDLQHLITEGAGDGSDTTGA